MQFWKTCSRTWFNIVDKETHFLPLNFHLHIHVSPFSGMSSLTETIEYHTSNVATTF